MRLCDRVKAQLAHFAAQPGVLSVRSAEDLRDELIEALGQVQEYIEACVKMDQFRALGHDGDALWEEGESSFPVAIVPLAMPGHGRFQIDAVCQSVEEYVAWAEVHQRDALRSQHEQSLLLNVSPGMVGRWTKQAGERGLATVVKGKGYSGAKIVFKGAQNR